MLDSSCARVRVASVELPEVTRMIHADEQRTKSEYEDMTPRPGMKLSYVCNKQITDDRVEEPPKNVDR